MDFKLHSEYKPTEDQISQVTDTIPFKHTTSTKQELEAELSRVLGKDITLPNDPQRKKNNVRPLIYVYAKGEGDYYYFSVTLHNDYSFARNLAQFYNVLEVSSEPDTKMNVKTYEELLNDEDFQKALNAKPYKEGYFKY